MKAMIQKISGFVSTPRGLALFVFLASAGILGAALVSQYVFGLQPCVLCLYQRVPFEIAIGISFACLFMPPALASRFLMFCGLTILAGAVIAGFHVGVEHKWWEGLTTCSQGGLPQNVSIEELQKFLNRAPIVRCDAVAWSLFGISMAGYNMMISAFLGLFTVLMSKKS